VAGYRSKYGTGLNLEQQINPDLGLFARVSWAQGNVQAYDFTDINASGSIGLSLKGTRWGRSNDTVGAAVAVNSISAAAQAYFFAGGLGILIGDGQLPKAGLEQIFETYYSLAVLEFAKVSFDYQFINNPAYNRQRGPVSVLGLRLHAEF
jgi:high affinity Mn2+ porin